MEEGLSFNQVVQGICDFIEVATHTILYVRQIYPPDLFVRRKKYETPVFQSRHPALNDYITGAVKAIRDEMMHDHVDKVVIVIKDKNEVPLERFIFSFDTLIHAEAFNKDTVVENAMTATALIYYFRAFLVKLTMMETTLGKLKETDDASFAIVLELKENATPSGQDGTDPPPWIPAVSQQTTAGASDNAELHMIRAVNTGIINVSLAVQESGAKVEREKKERKAAEKARKALEELKKAAANKPTTDDKVT